MKGKAIIILCCVLAYMGGWVAIPRIITHAQKGCCSKTAARQHQCLKEKKETGKCADCGTSCPMCYTMIMPAAVMEDVTMAVASKSYPDYHSTYLYGFRPDAWKPPNRV